MPRTKAKPAPPAMKRLNLRLEPGLHKEIKRMAVEYDTSAQKFAVEAIRKDLLRKGLKTTTPESPAAAP